MNNFPTSSGCPCALATRLSSLGDADGDVQDGFSTTYAADLIAPDADQPCYALPRIIGLGRDATAALSFHEAQAQKVTNHDVFKSQADKVKTVLIEKGKHAGFSTLTQLEYIFDDPDLKDLAEPLAPTTTLPPCVIVHRAETLACTPEALAFMGVGQFIWPAKGQLAVACVRTDEINKFDGCSWPA